ncbi:Ribonuclease P protein subunit p30 [Spatholobus suberectus]|nr:Ribonuclease P protein subunit p30 [Spatholobus suberectus]
MGYFDLNIPYPEPSPGNKATEQGNRTRLAVKAMELGYTGIAYNRTIKGVMSDRHRCSITPLTLSSLLNVLPSLSLSANLHRHLLRVPRSTPFRQYTRLTVSVDSPSQAQALNSGNPILKTYDLVAVKPSNQIAFDLACERMEVDIISIDFSAKLPFRLKQPMVKAATQRGVCFEVTYSGFFADIQIRRQLISTAKLLMDWTRGQNIVFSSAAPTVNELRGPCDVANLLSLFGLSKERANAAISKNCRILLANSLRKKRFYKEAIRVEILSSDAASHSKEDRHQELLKWDPISSGEGDILLDDTEKSSLAYCKESKTAKAIDFVSVVNSLPSHGFEIKDILPANNAFPVCPDNKINFLPVAKKLNQSTPVPNNLTELSNLLDVCPEQGENSLSDAITRSHTLSCDNIFEKNIHSETTEAVNLKEINTPTAIDSVSVAESLPSHGFQIKDFLPANSALPVIPDNKVNFLPVAKKTDQSIPVPSTSIPNNLTLQPDRLDVCPEQDESSQPLKQSDNILEKNIHSGTTEAFNSTEMDISTNATKLELKNIIDSDVDFIPFEAKALDSQSDLYISSNTLDIIKPHENEKMCGSSEDAKLDNAHNIDHKVEILDIICPALVHDKHNNEKSSDVNLNEQIGKIHEALPNEELKIAEQTALELNTSISDTSMEDKQFDNRETDAPEPDEMQRLTSYDEMKMEEDSTAAKHLLPDVTMKDKKRGGSTDSDQFAAVHSVSGGLRVKRRTPRGLPLFPFKRLLNPIPFKKKGRKSKSRTKLK